MLLKIVGKLVAGAERKVLEVQCSAFQKEHAIQSLIGSPMSYVGYGEGGLLQNFAKQHPDGVVILEKPELGHSNLLRLMSEILGGFFTAGDGQVISTRRLMVFVTSTVGADGNRAPIGFAADGTSQHSQIREALEEALGPALLGQIGWSNIFRLEPLEPAALRNILRLELHGYGKSLGVPVAVEEGVLEKIVNDCAKRGQGARAVLDEYRGAIEPLLDAELERGGAAGTVARLRLFVHEDGTICCRAESGGDGPEGASAGDPQ
jgi:ATP-dependent Clp protease ATP-binding subunit ClpA